MDRKAAAQKAFELALQYGYNTACASEKTEISNTGAGRYPVECYIVSIGGYPGAVFLAVEDSWEECFAELTKKITEGREYRVAQLKRELQSLERYPKNTGNERG
jgi:hypothetical protein